MGGWSLPARCGAALVLGVLLALALPPLSWWPLALVAVGGLALLCRDASLAAGACAGGAFGFGFVLVAMWWLHVVLAGSQLLVALGEAPFFALLGLGLAATSRLPDQAARDGWPLWAACCWVGMELARGTLPFGGLPWGRLALVAVDSPLVAWSRLAGEAGLTFVVALVATLLAVAVTSALSRGWPAAVAAAAVAVVLLAASALLPVGLQGPAGRTVTVAVVQGDVPGSGRDAFFAPRVTLANHVAETRRLAADVRSGRVPRPDVVIWPENASDVDPFLDASAAAQIQRAADEMGVPVVVGAVTQGARPDEVRGSGIVWHPRTGPADRYAKRRLVPFGEWVPFRAALEPVVPLVAQEIPRDFVPGERPGVLRAAGVVVGAVMCFEVAYDRAIRDVALGDVDLLAVQTNNATYLGTGQMEQQWAITRLRAVETGRSVAVAATTGISGVVAPDGTVLRRTVGRSPQSLVVQVPAGEGETPGVRWGGLVEVVGSAVAALATVVALVRPRRRMRRG